MLPLLTMFGKALATAGKIAKATGSTALAFGKGALGMAGKSSSLAAGKWGAAASQLGQGVNKLAMNNVGKTSQNGSRVVQAEEMDPQSQQFETMNAPLAVGGQNNIANLSPEAEKMLLEELLRKRQASGGM